MTKSRARTKIRSGARVANHLPQLREWFLAEWGKIDPFEGNHPEVTVPEPLLAFGSEEQLQGGLVFSTFDLPDPGKTRVWINAVYVAPEYRGQNIASALISLAENSARQIHIDSLFVFTNIPRLYENLGWRLVERNGADCVLTKNLLSSASLSG